MVETPESILKAEDDEHGIMTTTTNPIVFDDFIPWFHSRVTFYKPDIIVAIARGAIRLLQLHGINDAYLSVNIVSDNTLPFYLDHEIEGKRIMIFDDSLIFGSTMDSVRNYIQSRKGIPFCTAYVIDRRNFFGEGKLQTDPVRPSEYFSLPIDYKHSLWPADIRMHHDHIVRRLLDTPNHYNLDFPTIQIKVNSLESASLPLFLQLVKHCFNTDKVIDLSSSDSAVNGLFRFTVLLPTPSNAVFNTDKIVFRPYTKIRLTFSTNTQQIRITPIVQLSIDDTFDLDESPFVQETLNNYWKQLVKPTQQDIFLKQSLFRLMTSLVTTLFLKEEASSFISQIMGKCATADITFLDGDVKSSIGHRNAAELSNIYQMYQPLGLFKPTGSTSDEHSVQIDDTNQKELIDRLNAFWSEKPHLKPHQSELVYEILGKIFLCLRHVTDSPAIRRQTPRVDRINVGFSFEALKYLVATVCGIPFTMDDISIGMDICVDNGQAVPKVLQCSSKWARYFYSGERSESIDPLQFKHYYHRAYSDYLGTKKSALLTPFDLHKLTVTLKDIYSWLPISTKYYIYGRYAMPTQIEAELIPWLTDGPNPPFILSRDEDGADCLTTNQTYHVSPQTAWTNDRVRDVLDSFQYVATVFSRLTSEHKLLLSTCKTHRHTYNAVAYEAHAWAYKGRFNFANIASICTLEQDKLKSVNDDILNNLFWCIRYITESQTKYHIFYSRFEKLKAKIDSVFRTLGNPYLRFWQLMLSPKITKDMQPEIEGRFSVLMPIISQMQALTSFTLQFLLRASFISKTQLEDKFKKEGLPLHASPFEWIYNDGILRTAYRYNQVIEKQLIPGLSIIKTNLPEFVEDDFFKSSDNVKACLESISDCYQELNKVLGLYCPEYDILEGDFPFSPANNPMQRSDGTTEILFNNAYIMTMDIIGSTNSHQTNDLKMSILKILNDFRRPNLYHEVTGNDEYIVCGDEPSVLLDIANAIQMEGERLRASGSRFGGTRKGFSFGAVKVINYPDNRIAIMDATIPNIIPSSFYMLSAIEETKSSEDTWNSLIAVNGYIKDR